MVNLSFNYIYIVGATIKCKVVYKVPENSERYTARLTIDYSRAG